MNKTEFRANPDLVKQWRDELRKNELLRTVLGVMEEESPDRHAPETTDSTAVSVAYGLSKGYSLYDRELRALGEHTAPPKFLKATYGVPDQPAPK